jgi:hypothetical protein
MKRQIVIILAGPVLALAALTGCASVLARTPSPAAATPATATPATATPATATAPAASARIACSEQVAWAQHGAASVKALYADTGALSADASANNLPGVAKAGRKLASDAIAAAALPLPPVDPGAWKTLTADYAVAGTAIAGGDASGAVPQLEEGNSAISAFSAATGKC